MSPVGPGGSKFAELVTDHIFRYVNRDELVSIMHRDVEPHEFREDDGSAGPGFDQPAVIGSLCGLYFFFQVLIDKRPFF